LGAQLPLRADREHVAHKQQPDDQRRIDRRPTRMRVIGRKLLVYPIQIENAVNLPDQMIRRYHLVEIKPVEELTLSALCPPIIDRSLRIAVLIHGITVQPQSQPEFCNTIRAKRTSHSLLKVTTRY